MSFADQEADPDVAGVLQLNDTVLVLRDNVALRILSETPNGRWQWKGDAKDSSGRNHDGTLMGGATVANGILYLVAASSEYVDLGAIEFLDSTKPFTISAWVWIDALGATSPRICSLMTNIGENFQLAFSVLALYNNISFGSRTTGGTFWNRSKSPADIISLKRWHHVVVTYNGLDPEIRANFKLYLNGVNIALAGIAGTFGSSTVSSKIGAKSNPANNFWDGKIGEFFVAPHEFTEEEVKIVNALGPQGVGHLNLLELADMAASPTVPGQVQLNGEDLEQYSAGAARVLCKEEMTHSLIPKTDDIYYLGENPSPFKAYKGVILKDTADGKHYRIEVTNGVVVATVLD